MCRFPYLAVQLREDMFDGSDVLGPVSRIAKRHGLRVQPTEVDGSLARFGEGAHLVTTFAVNGCACDWGASQHEALAAIARDLLLATDVRRVRVGLWTKPPLHLEIDTDALAEVDWGTDVWLEIRRAARPPFPTRPLRKLSLGID